MCHAGFARAVAPGTRNPQRAALRFPRQRAARGAAYAGGLYTESAGLCAGFGIGCTRCHRDRTGRYGSLANGVECG